MKNKIKKQKNKVFFAILLVGLFFGVSIKAATLEEQCIFSGGTFNGNKCTNCGCDKVTGPGQGAVCVTKDEYNLAVSFMDPADAPEIKITECKAAVTTPASTKKLNYTLLESFPGFFQGGKEMTDLPTMILAIYKFGIWTVGIAGLFMLVVGGFMYMASAGNTSTASSARGIITDSLIGIIAAMGAYLILYVINPDLTKINVSFTPVEVVNTLGFGEGGGNCSVPTTGPCTVEALQKTCFGSNAKAAAMVCGYESGGNVGSPSKSDKGADGNVFSWGLFQINLTQHKLGGFDCQKAFEGENYASKVINPALYANCKTAATTAMTNINYACKISNNGINWGPWKNTKKACGL